MDLTGKNLDSFDIQALITNIPTKESLNAVKKVVRDLSENELPVTKRDFINLVSLCINVGPVMFNGVEYFQHSGLVMGSPFSLVVACLYLEELESTSYIKLMGKDTHWWRYVDDNLVVVPEFVNLR
ncbi:uncharacterized protein LOC143023518 [Oratosquilla oratoria]|uniref:uncharacterized protein LOC143023518 n=1 Tax=Oratosquilla oratoria TaxID=337810 RepID=UPI003F772199